MLFEWDPHKGKENIKKHGVSFEIATTIFDDPMHLSVLDQRSSTEERWITIGQAATGTPVVVVHAYRKVGEHESIRIISARKATRKEKRQYEEGI